MADVGQHPHFMNGKYVDPIGVLNDLFFSQSASTRAEGGMADNFYIIFYSWICGDKLQKIYTE